MIRLEHEVAERYLFETLKITHCADAVFVLGAPRSGSTLLYQAVCSRFGLPYIANITNELFAFTPIVGLALQKAASVKIGFESSFGKTKGPFQPSEGSAVMKHWFGAGDPPALKGARIRAGLEPHFLATLRAAASLFGAPLVIKNAWNCFRLPYLAQILPNARFIWIRRDAADAAKSDLEARYKTKGDPNAWNSAMPGNIAELRRLPPAYQVVENQHAFNRAIRDGLERFAPGRLLEIWHEDFRLEPDKQLARVGELLGRTARPGAPEIDVRPSSGWDISAAEDRMIDEYVERHQERLAADRNPARLRHSVRWN